MASTYSISLALALVWVGAGQGFLLSAALLRSKKGSLESNRALAALILLLSSMVALGIVMRGKELPTPALYNVGAPFDFLFGPFLYFYFRSLVTGKAALGKKDPVHFLPFVGCILYLIPTSFVLDPATKMALFREAQHAKPLSRHVMGILQCSSVIAYSLYSTLIYSRLKASLLENFSNVDARHLHWLEVLLYSYLGFGIVGLLEQVLPSAPIPSWLVPIGGAAVLLSLGYIGHFAPWPYPSQAVPRPKKSGLKPESIARYTKELTRVMEVEKLFLDGNLSLQRLAKKMNLPAGQLSELLNDHLHQKFFDLVNHYRVQEAKRILDHSPQSGLNMLELGFEVGFNSKSTFYSAFKKLEGCTPLAYSQRRS